MPSFHLNNIFETNTFKNVFSNVTENLHLFYSHNDRNSEHYTKSMQIPD